MFYQSISQSNLSKELSVYDKCTVINKQLTLFSVKFPGAQVCFRLIERIMGYRNKSKVGENEMSWLKLDSKYIHSAPSHCRSLIIHLSSYI